FSDFLLRALLEGKQDQRFPQFLRQQIDRSLELREAIVTARLGRRRRSMIGQLHAWRIGKRWSIDRKFAAMPRQAPELIPAKVERDRIDPRLDGGLRQKLPVLEIYADKRLLHHVLRRRLVAEIAIHESMQRSPMAIDQLIER